MGESRRAVIEKYADEGYVIPEHWTQETLTIVECKRLARAALMARYASEVPRRLGHEATSVELSADKKLSRRIAYAYISLWGRFIRSAHAPLPPETCPAELMPPNNWKSAYVMAAADDEIKRLGATVEWEAWWEEVRPRLLARRMVIASFSVENSYTSWGYRIVSGISDEIEWVDEKFAMWHRAVERTNGRVP